MVTDIPSNREWVKQEENGWLALGTADFATMLLRVSQLTARQSEKISENNRRTVALRADWSKNFALLLQLFGRLVDSGKR